jgi:hypothetical protein
MADEIGRDPFDTMYGGSTSTPRFTFADLMAGKLPPEVEQKMAAEALRSKATLDEARQNANQYGDLAVIAQLSNNPALANAANMLDKRAQAQYTPEKLGTQGFVIPGTGEFVASPMYHDEKRAAQIEKMFQFQQLQEELNRRAAEAEQGRADRAAAQRQTAELGLSLKAAIANQATTEKKYEADLRAASKSATDEKTLNKNVTNLTTALNKAQQPQLEEAISNIEAVLKKYPEGELPGVGRFESRKPSMFQTDEEQQVQADIQGPMNIMTAMRSGMAVSDQEMKRIVAEFGGKGTGMDEKTLRHGVARMRALLNANTKNLIAGASPEVLATYNERAGTNFQHAGGAGAATDSGLTADQQARLEELRAKKAKGTLDQ